MNYQISNEFCFDIFDDGDILASSILKPKGFLLNKTTWFVIKLFDDSTSFDDAKQKFIDHYYGDKNFLANEFEKIFNKLLQSGIIKGV